MPTMRPAQAPGQDTSGMLGAAGDSALGTQLTAQALSSSPAAGIPLHVPENYPVSLDVEVRGRGTTAPTPPLMDRMRSGWNTFAEKARLFGMQASGHDPYAPDVQGLAQAQQMYRPGRDAASNLVRSGR